MYSVQEITEEGIWDDFVLSHPQKTFLHSWAWGEIQQKTGEPIWRLGVFLNDVLIGVALVVKIEAKRGTFLFIPHGPLFQQWHGDAWQSLLHDIKQRASKERAHWIRISPYVGDESDAAQQIIASGFRPAPIHMHAEITWQLDLTPPEDDVLKNMRKTTRNLIRRAEREGVTIRMGSDQALIDTFYALHADTVKRHRFVPFKKTFIESEVQEFSPNILIAIAEHNGHALAGAVVPIYGDTGYYHHGASIGGKIPAGQLLQWRLIQELKRQGIVTYNFWGIAEEGDTKHPPRAWKGLTLFKKGFGGERREYMHAQDLPLSWRYWLNYVLEIFRNKRRSSR